MMGKISGRETRDQLPEKVILLYKAIEAMVEEGIDPSSVKVSQITDRAGIGKGTAYDYFDSKEELVVYALLYHIENMLRQLQRGIWEQENFAGRVELILERICGQIQEGSGTLRLMLMLFDNTQMGQQLRKEMERRRAQKACEPLQIVEAVIRKGLEDGELRSDMPVSYMTYSFTSRILAYVMYLLQPGQKECPDEAFRKQICQGILNEFHAKKQALYS